MIDVLEPLTALPGVNMAMLATQDGVPIAFSRSADLKEDEHAAGLREDALGALAVGWANELRLATAPLSWSEPQRAVLRCARGSIVLRRMRGAVLMLVLGRGVSPEDVRLSMDGTVARIERSLRGADGGRPAFPDSNHPPGPLPNTSVNDVDGLAAPGSNTSPIEGLSGN